MGRGLANDAIQRLIDAAIAKPGLRALALYGRDMTMRQDRVYWTAALRRPEIRTHVATMGTDRFTFTNGSVIDLVMATEPDQLRGIEYHELADNMDTTLEVSWMARDRIRPYQGG
jgi:hypothetical protein